MSRRRRRQTPSTATVQAPTADDIAQALLKAIRAPQPVVTQIPQGGQGFGGYGSPLTPVVSGMGGQPAGLSRPLGWTDPLVPFGPGAPIRPAAIDPLDPRTGRPAPRRSEYPVSWNLPNQGDRVVPWTVLRELGQGVGVIRKCIEIRKTQMTTLEWDITPSESAFEAAMLEHASTSSKPVQARAQAAAAGDPQARIEQASAERLTRAKFERDFRERNAHQIAELKRWWSKPDRINDWTFGEWLAAVLEEHLVLDALTIYPHLTLGGELHSLEIIDGSTIKPLLDHRGSTPQPPNPAYQQILHGFPRGEFLASEDGVEGEYGKDALIYRPRHRRTYSPYGLSPTEQAILDADLWLKRRQWIVSEYDDGVVPELLVEVDSPMTPSQLQDYERIFNDLLSGNIAERHRAKMLPQGFKPTLLPSLEQRYKPDYDLYLLRLIASHFDVSAHELGFPPSGGLGGAGFGEADENIQYRRAIKPTSEWLTDIINEISMRWLGMDDGLTFRFLGLEAEDEAAAMQAMELQVKTGGMTINEMRDETGLPRYSVPEADMPLIMAGRGVIPLEGLLDRSNVVLQPKEPAAGNGGPDQQNGPNGQQRNGNQGGAVNDRQSPDAPGQEGEPRQGSGPKTDASSDSGNQGNSGDQGKAAEPEPVEGPDTATVAGLAVQARSTGRVLMLQRSLDETDPAAGRWEFPGGHVEGSEHPLEAARREWSEETGLHVPPGDITGGWRHNVYEGFVLVVPDEDAVPIRGQRWVSNPDDPDGDVVEALAWWSPADLDGNPSVRQEILDSLDVVLSALGAGDEEKAAEAQAFRRYLKRVRTGDRPWRPFTFTAHPGYVADAANELASVGHYTAAAAALDVTVP